MPVFDRVEGLAVNVVLATSFGKVSMQGFEMKAEPGVEQAIGQVVKVAGSRHRSGLSRVAGLEMAPKPAT
ncbi:unnamed protein product [Clonostachys chloroleuca]|uniref:Uncharacterized protein n=1 Tax=Clonostachys chloroleuca TaxID=1926264 RepID=A0AA35MJA9_9HYPO|nr:unnamed protein product [Clonostachys chloroleuca]